MTFNLTREKVHTNQMVSVYSAGVSIGCCVLVLLLSLWVWSVRSARGFLDRVSFRLLLWSMFFEIIYDVNYIAVVMSASPTVINGKLDSAANARCSTGIYFMISTLGVVNYLCTAIAVNLAITIVLGLNPVILKLERWYVGVSLFVGFFVPIVPAALGHFGYDPIFFVCWIQAENDKRRMLNFVLDLYLWQLLSCFIATFCVAATLIKLFRQGRATSRALFEGNSINLEISDNSWDHDEKPEPRSLVSRIFRRKKHSHEKEHMFGHLEDRFIRIALRISLYPVSLIIVNGLITIGDLFISAQGGVKNKTVYGLYCVYYFLYGGRGIFFAALGLFVDPCLPRGLRAAWKAHFPRDPGPNSFTMEPKAPITSSAGGIGCITPQGTRVDQLAASTVTNGGSGDPDACLEPKTVLTDNALTRQDSSGSMDMLHALLMSGPPEDHDHWTHEWHSGAHGQELMDAEDKLRRDRHSHRSHSLPVSLSRFLRRGSRRTMSAKSVKSDDMIPAEPEEVKIPPIAEFVPERSPKSSSPPPLKPLDTPELPSLTAKSSPRTPQEGFTMTFAGVAAGALPEGFDDHAHDVVHPEALQAAEAAAAAAAAAAAEAARAAALARQQQQISPSVGSRSAGNRTPAASSGASTPVFNFGRGRNSGKNTPDATPLRRGSLVSSLASGSAPPRRGSLGDGVVGGGLGLSFGLRRDSSNATVTTGGSRIPPQRRATTGVTRSSMESPLTPIEERRQRRDRALQIAERLYEEMEAQL